MKKLIVLFFFFCFASAGWQQSGSIPLPRALSVTDLTIDNSGGIWILASSSISKLDGRRITTVFDEVTGKCLAVLNRNIDFFNQEGRLVKIRPDGTQIESSLLFNNPIQITATTVEQKPLFFVLEPGELTFVSEDKVIGSMAISAERVAIIPNGDYTDNKTPFFTLNNNQITLWSGGDISDIGLYKSQLLFSSTDQIIDFCVDNGKNLYMLFSDSMIVLDSTGTKLSQLCLENIGLSSRIIFSPKTRNLYLYESNNNVIEILSRAKFGQGELIVLKKNYPNPVDDYTEIKFVLGQSLNITLTVYNLIGEPVKVLARGRFSEGAHKIVWHAEDEKGNLMPNGVYFYRLESEKGVAIRQLVILR